MRRSLEAFIVALAALSCVILQAQTPAPVRLETAPAAGIVDSVLVPAGTTLALELQDSLNTRYAKKGDRVSFKTTSEVLIDGRVAIPRESSVDATIVAAKRAGLAQKGGEVQLALDRIVLPDGTSLPLLAKLARPGHWSRSDKIAPEGPSDRDGWQNLQTISGKAINMSVMGAMIGNSDNAAMAMAAGAGAIIGLLEILLERGPELDLPPGILFQAELTTPLTVPVAAAGNEQVVPPSPQPPSPPPRTEEPLAESVAPSSNTTQAPLDSGPLPKAETTPDTTVPPDASVPPSLASVRRASEAPVAETNSGFKFSVNVNLVLVEATVRDERGSIYIKLRREDFHVLEDGVEQEICHFSRDELPLAVAVVIDRSGSVAQVMNRLRRAAYRLKRQIEGARFHLGMGRGQSNRPDLVKRIHPGSCDRIRHLLFQSRKLCKLGSQVAL